MPLKPVIRLVKRAYDEPSGVAFEKKSNTGRAYYDLASRMLEALGRASGERLVRRQAIIRVMRKQGNF